MGTNVDLAATVPTKGKKKVQKRIPNGKPSSNKKSVTTERGGVSGKLYLSADVLCRKKGNVSPPLKAGGYNPPGSKGKERREGRKNRYCRINF